MNIFKAELDTIHQNGVIGPITQFDNATLELQILSGGQVGESWNSPQFELIAMKHDMNPVREVEQDKFTILSNEEHRVRIELKEQFLTCRGTVKMQLIVKDGNRTSTTIFRLSVGQSLDHDIVTSIRDVEVLDQLDLYVAQGFSVINEAIEITGELKKEMTEINNEASQFEKERQVSELTRNQRELVRVDNEEDRVANELERIQNEEIRVTNEEERVSSENTRITNENNRRTHENTRISQEAARQEAERQRNAIFEENENIRSEQENTRIKSENERKKKFTTWEERETIRLKSEENRILQERERVENEENRKRQELTRQNQEEYRQRTYTQFNEAEASRVNNEIQREASEKQRQQAEKNRDATYQRREENRDTEYGKAEEVRNSAFEQNEANRQNEYTVAERERVESEELRKGRERDRANAETKRQEAETARANAESGRVEKFKQEIKKAKTTMDTATSNVNAAISQSDATMQGIEQRAEGCLPVIEKSASAKVDYMGNQHESIKDAMDANVEFVLDEVNTVHYEDSNITATDTIERQVKQAELKGCTLVNLCPNKVIDYMATSNWDGFNGLAQSSNTQNYSWKTLQDLRPNTKYFISCYVETFDVGKGEYYLFNNNNQSTVFNDTLTIYSTGLHKWVLTSKREFTEEVFVALRCQNAYARGAIKIKNIMIIEYQEGMENWDIPYFEGMKSVQMPDLTMTGKNLFDVKKATPQNGLTIGEDFLELYQKDGNAHFRFNVPVSGFKVGSYYKYSAKVEFLEVAEGFELNNPLNGYLTGMNNYLTYNNSTGISEGYITAKSQTITFGFHNSNKKGAIRTRWSNIQIEEVESLTSSKTFYEPYQSNILSAPEDVELGSVDAVKDELNLVTGELTQRTDIRAYREGDESNPEVLTDLTNTRYKLAKEVVKTVDLKGQKVYSYDGTTHYICSAAEGSLVPTLSIDVPTNLPALVSRQRVTIENQKKQIITLEQENEQLIAQNEVQDTDIALNQDAINFMLFAPSVKSISEDKGGVSTMAAYLANQILKGRLDYTLVISRYGEFKEDIDTILIAEGKQDLIK